MMPYVGTVNDLAKCDLSRFAQGGKTAIKGTGLSTLKKFQTRARLLVDPQARPYCTTVPSLPDADVELFL